MPRILTINDIPRTHEPRSAVEIVHETEISAMMDGGNNVGYYAVYQAMKVAIAKAKKSRIAIVGMYRSQMSGRNAYYLEHIAREGLVGIHLATGMHLVLPHGGAKPALGTNPIAFGFPTSKDPFIIDFGTAGMMLGEVILRSRTGQALPEGIAVDSTRRPDDRSGRSAQRRRLSFRRPSRLCAVARHPGHVPARGLGAGLTSRSRTIRSCFWCSTPKC